MGYARNRKILPIVFNRIQARKAGKSRSFLLRTHDLYGGKGLSEYHHFMLSLYLIEKQTRSVLALTGSPCVTHDVYEAKGVSLKRPPFDPQPASNDHSLTLAYSLVSLLQQEFTRSTFHKDVDNQDHAGKNKPAQNKDPREVRRVFVRLR